MAGPACLVRSPLKDRPYFSIRIGSVESVAPVRARRSNASANERRSSSRRGPHDSVNCPPVIGLPDAAVDLCTAAPDRPELSVTRREPASKQGEDLGELRLAAQEGRRLNRQVRPPERPQRRELSLAELVQANRVAQVLEPMLTEVAQPGFDHLCARRRRSTCSPWAAEQILAARWTSIPLK